MKTRMASIAAITIFLGCGSEGVENLRNLHRSSGDLDGTSSQTQPSEQTDPNRSTDGSQNSGSTEPDSDSPNPDLRLPDADLPSMELTRGQDVSFVSLDGTMSSLEQTFEHRFLVMYKVSCDGSDCTSWKASDLSQVNRRCDHVGLIPRRTTISMDPKKENEYPIKTFALNVSFENMMQRFSSNPDNSDLHVIDRSGNVVASAYWDDLSEIEELCE